jgi:hypothetical protein
VTIERAEAVFRHCVLEGRPRREWLAAVASALSVEDEAALGSILRVGHVLSWGSQRHAVRHIMTPASSATALALALYCLLLEDEEARAACMLLLPAESVQIVEWAQLQEQKREGLC